MEQLLFGIFSAFGLSASAGLNAYIPLFTIAIIAHFTNWFKLNPPYDALGNPWIVILLGVLVIIEFLADKIPAVNHLNDLLQTFVRPVAGAIVFAASAKVLTDISPVLSLACGLFIAGGIHAVKSLAIRPAVTAATAGAGNVPVSLAEDLLAALTSFLAIVLPVIIACVFVLLAALLIWRLWRRSKARA
ncbi:MAG: DUF4126 domain-containing protein [Anaerolineales bacterium]